MLEGEVGDAGVIGQTEAGETRATGSQMANALVAEDAVVEDDRFQQTAVDGEMEEDGIQR